MLITYKRGFMYQVIKTFLKLILCLYVHVYYVLFDCNFFIVIIHFSIPFSADTPQLLIQSVKCYTVGKATALAGTVNKSCTKQILYTGK